MLTITYSLTQEDYIDYYLHVAWDGPHNSVKWRNYYLKQIFTILFLVGIFYYTGNINMGNTMTLLICALLAATALLSLIGVRSGLVRKARAFTEDPANSNLFEETQLIVTDHSIQVKAITTDTIFKWEAFNQKQESPAHYFLFLYAINALIIPKRIFQHQADRESFEKMLSKHLSLDAEVNGLRKS